MKKSVEFFLKTVCIILFMVLSFTQAWGVKGETHKLRVVKDGNGIVYQLYAMEDYQLEDSAFAEVIPDESHQFLDTVAIPATIKDGDSIFVVRSIQDKAFKDCRGLECLKLSEKLRLIGDSAFYGCTKLTEINLPSSAFNISKSAFAGCTGVYRLVLNCTQICEWFSSIRNQITEVVLGENVGYLYDGAFYEFRNVQTINLPSRLHTIKANVFKGWNSLKSIYIPASVTEISPLAFASCPALDIIQVDEDNYKYDSRNNCNAVIETSTNKLVLGCSETVIPNTVTQIGEKAFYGTDLRAINIPAKVVKIGSEAFNYCSHLESITVASGNTAYDSRDNCNAIIEKATNRILFGCYKTEFPSTLSGIAPNAFAGVSKTMNVRLPDSFTKVDKQAFHDCTGLNSIYLPFYVQVIDTMAFYGCKNLKTILSDDGRPDCSLNFGNIYEIGLQAFRDCSGLDTLVIPDNLGKLGREVWMNCTGLKRVVIEAGSVMELPYGTFQNCSNLQEVVLPNMADYKIGEYAFKGCKKIKRVYCTYEFGMPQLSQRSFEAGLESLYVYDVSNEELYPWFEFFSNIIYMTDQNHLIDGIYYNMVVGYLEVTSDQEDDTGISKPYKYSGDIVIPDSVKLGGGTYPVTCIAEKAFQGNPNITSVTIGKEMEFIGQSAFEDCTGLTSVTIAGSKPFSTAPMAFKGCKNLKHVALRDSTVVISDETFMNCSALEQMQLPKDLWVLGANSFANCTKLKSVTIPDSVSVIDEYTFYRCDSLRSVTLNKDLKHISAYAFSYNQKLADITLPKSLTSIGKSAFLDCRGLTDITLPEKTLTIGEGAFRYCYGLKNIQLPKGLKKVENQVFANCGNLTTIALPEAVATVGDQAFFQCGNIVSLTLEKGVKDIGEMAFSGCPLVNIYCKPVTAPNAFENSFSDNAYKKATLFLPENTDSTYHNHLVWKRFQKGSLSKYELRYVYDGDQLFKRDSINGGAIITPAAIPVKGTHRFSGWKGEPELMPAKDTTIVGNFLYGISFLVKKDGKIVVDKDTLIQDKNLPDSLFYGEKVTAPKSWIEGFGIRWQGLPETMPAKDLAIVGQYAINKYAVTYIVDGQFYRRDSVEYLDKVVPPTMQKENYIFEWGSYPATMPAKDITVYGQFTPQIFAGGINIRINKEERYAEVVKYSNSVTSITSVVIPETVTLEGVSYPVRRIADNAFNGFKQLASVQLPSTLEYIGEQAFRDCQSLTSITIPEKVTEISYGTFMYCGKLTEIIMHNKVEKIGSQAFNSCGSLTDVHLYKVSNIGGGAFANDKNIVRIYSDATEVPQLAANAFESVVYQNATVYVKYNAMELFKADAIWKQFYTFDYISTYYVTYILNGKEYKKYTYKTGEEIVKEPDPVDGTRVFSGWSDIPDVMGHEDIVVTGNFRYILSFQFEGKTVGRKTWVFCGTPVQKPTIAERQDHIIYWENAFDVMPDRDTVMVGYYIPQVMVDGLIIRVDKEKNMATVMPNPDNNTATSVDIPKTVTIEGVSYPVTAIAANAFEGYGNLEEVSLPTTLTTIGEYAFTGCSQLSVIISKSVTVPVLPENAIDAEVFEQASVKVPDIAKESYMNDAVWGKFGMFDYYYMIGDVNNDMVVDVEDIVATVNIIMGEVGENYIIEAADVNHDYKIDVEDLVMMINMILDQNTVSAPQMRRMRAILLENGFIF